MRKTSLAVMSVPHQLFRVYRKRHRKFVLLLAYRNADVPSFNLKGHQVGMQATLPNLIEKMVVFMTQYFRNKN